MSVRYVIGGRDVSYQFTIDLGNPIPLPALTSFRCPKDL